MKTSELTGPALDWAVAKCEGWIDDCNSWLYHATLPEVEDGHYKPSTDWSQGGPIIEREGINLFRMSNDWGAGYCEPGGCTAYGDTPLIAAMRCYVASKLGDEVDVPAELIPVQSFHEE